MIKLTLRGLVVAFLVVSATNSVAQMPPATVGDLMSGRQLGIFLSSPQPDFSELPSGITVTAIQAHGFMAPGSYDVLEVEIHNPVDSPYTIAGVSGYSFSRVGYPYNALASEYVHSNLAPPGCDERQFLCAQGAGFPLAPGQSARFAVHQVWSDPGFPAGNVMVNAQRFKLRLQSAGVPEQTAYSPVLTFLRIMNHEGSPDWQIFTDLQQSDAPLTPPDRPRLQVSLRQPGSVRAGEPVALYAEVNNIGDITVQRPRVMAFPGMSNPGGNVGGNAGENTGEKFSFIACQADCVLAGPQQLAPGEQWLIRIGTLVYRGQWLQEDSFQLDNLLLSVSDTDHFTVTDIHSLGNTITFTHSGPPVLNPAMQLTPRAPMQALQHGLVRDPATGNEWLPPVHTVGKTRAQLDEWLDSDPAYRGLMIASAKEVETLLENFVLSQGVVPGPLGLQQAGSHALVAQIAEFVRGAGVTDSVAGRPSLRGIVNDLPLLRAGHEQRLNSVVIRAPASRTISEQRDWGLTLVEEPVMENNPMRAATGYWLVRRPGGIRFLPARPAMATEDRLILTRVRVDGQLLIVRLQLIDSFDTLLRVSSIRQVPESPEQAEQVNFIFDDSSGTLNINEAWLTLPDGSTETWRLRLQHVPFSNPPVLDMVEAERTGQ